MTAIPARIVNKSCVKMGRNNDVIKTKSVLQCTVEAGNAFQKMGEMQHLKRGETHVRPARVISQDYR